MKNIETTARVDDQVRSMRKGAVLLEVTPNAYRCTNQAMFLSMKIIE